jgi:hypothetical protein
LRPEGQEEGETVPDDKICAACGRHVSADDRYCVGCGIAFGSAPGRVGRAAELPGFGYHFVQGLGWGLGLAVAVAVILIMPLLIVALATNSIR